MPGVEWLRHMTDVCLTFKETLKLRQGSWEQAQGESAVYLGCFLLVVTVKLLLGSRARMRPGP